MIRLLTPTLCLCLLACDGEETPAAPTQAPSPEPAEAAPEPEAAPSLIQAASFDPNGDLWVARLSSPPSLERLDAQGAASREITLEGVDARIGAFEAGADGSLVVALAWESARVPAQSVLRVGADGSVERRCQWQAEASERWRSMPRGAASVASLPTSGTLVGGRDSTLVHFGPACEVTVLHDTEDGTREQSILVVVDGTRVTAAPLGTVHGPPFRVEPGAVDGCDARLRGDELVVDSPGDEGSWTADIATAREAAGDRGPPGPVVSNDGCRRVGVLLGPRVAMCTPTGCRLLGDGRG